MRDCNQGRFRQQLSFLRRQFLQEGKLPFSNVLSDSIVQQALSDAEVVWNQRSYTPLMREPRAVVKQKMARSNR